MAYVVLYAEAVAGQEYMLIHRPIVALVVFGLAGCGAEELNGQVDVSWTLADGTCDELEVTRVSVRLMAAGSVVDSSDYDCSVTAVSLTSVLPGTYTVFVDGFHGGDERPRVTAKKEGVVVVAGHSVLAGALVLQEAPGGVDLTWEFEAGFACGIIGDGVLLVEVSDTAEGSVVHTDEINCNPLVAHNHGNKANDPWLGGGSGAFVGPLAPGDYTVDARAFVVGPPEPGEEPDAVGSGSVSIGGAELAPLKLVLK